MITPVVLILASGSLTLSTSQRLSREIDRTRKVGNMLKDLIRSDKEEEKTLKEISSLFNQLKRSSKRVRHLQRAMTSLYISLVFFVATSISIGIVDVLELTYNWLPIILVLAGSAMLFYASIELISETRLAYLSVNNEMDRAIDVVKDHFPYLKVNK